MTDVIRHIAWFMAALLLTCCSTDNEERVQRDMAYRQAAPMVKQDGRLVFAVISDTHVGNFSGEGYEVKVPQALRHLTGHGRLDAMVVVGDLTENGTTGEYEEFVQFFGSGQNILHPVDRFLFMTGNHDNFDSRGLANYSGGLKAFNGNQPYPLHQ